MTQRLIATAAVLFSPIGLVAFSDGAETSNTGAPNENGQACAQCHNGAGNPRFGSGVEVVFPGGLTYAPGIKQTLLVRISAPRSNINGFQLSVRPDIDARVQAGDLASNDELSQVICLDRRAKPCLPGAATQFAEQTLAGSRASSWSLSWTPPLTSIGPIHIYVAGNASNGNGASSGDSIFLNSYTLAPLVATPVPQLRAAQPVLQAFHGGARISTATWIEIYGANLAPVTQDWSGLLTNNNTTAPTSMNGVNVAVDGKSAFLYYTSPTQINAQVPDGIRQGPIIVEVANAGGSSSVTVNATAASPAMLTTPAFNVGGVQYVAALFASPLRATYVGRAGLIAGASFAPAKPGDIITIYSVGCGDISGTSAGTVVTGVHAIPNVQVRIGQVIATAAAAMAPGSIGLCQFNVTIPNIASGDQDIEATVAGEPTGQGLKITVQ